MSEEDTSSFTSTEVHFSIALTLPSPFTAVIDTQGLLDGVMLGVQHIISRQVLTDFVGDWRDIVRRSLMTATQQVCNSLDRVSLGDEEMPLRKYATGEVTGVSAEDPQGVSAEAVASNPVTDEDTADEDED